MKRLNVFYVLISISFLVFKCTNLTNPFLDKEGAMAKFVKSDLAVIDTVDIFSTKSIRVDLYLREHLDSFKIHIDNNRLWNSSDTVVSEDEFTSKYRFSFPVSFFDTGWQYIQLISYINNGNAVTNSSKVYARSPLSQAAISGGIGDLILLSTKPVNDNVLYVWDFHNGVKIKESTPVVKTRISASFISSVGELYIEDLAKHRSPSVLFPITSTEHIPEFTDTTSPQIKGKRCNGVPVETYYTSRTDSMLLELDIVDSSRIVVTVNGKPVVKSRTELYTTMVFVEHKKDSTAFIITATDSAGNSAADTIFVKYNQMPEWTKTPSNSVIIAGEESKFEINVTDPDNDTLFVTMIIKDSSEDIVLNASSGQTTWTPQVADIGEYDVALRATDGYEDIEENFVIVVKGIIAVPVKFLTTKEDFPDTVFIGKPMNVNLEEIPLSGTRPFSYTAYFINSEGRSVKTILNEGIDSVVRWTATTADTGMKQLRVVVKDSYSYMDTIETDIRVMKEIVAFLRWENNYLPKFSEDSPVGASVKLIMKPALNYEISIPYIITFPATDDAAKASDISSQLSGNILFGKNDTVSLFYLEINDDAIFESTEKFEVSITENDSIKFQSGVDKKFHGEIIDNDIPQFSFDIDGSSGSESVSEVNVKVKLDQQIDTAVVLQYSVTDSNLVSGKDYTISPFDTLIFAKGTTERVITIRIIDDTVPEDGGVLSINLSSNSQLVKPGDKTSYHYTIIPNELPVSFNGTYMGVNERLEKHSITIRAEGNLEADLTVYYRADTSSTADEGIDFRITSSCHCVTLPRGFNSSAEMVFFTIDDFRNEGYETINFILTEVSNKKIAYIGKQSIYTVRIDDNGNDNR